MTVTVRRDIQIPNTVDGWELYDKPGAAVAAQAITDAVTCALALPTGTPSERYRQVVEPVLLKYAAFGAYDSEPVHHVRRVFAQAFGETVIGW